MLHDLISSVLLTKVLDLGLVYGLQRVEIALLIRGLVDLAFNSFGRVVVFMLSNHQMRLLLACKD